MKWDDEEETLDKTPRKRGERRDSNELGTGAGLTSSATSDPITIPAMAPPERPR